MSGSVFGKGRKRVVKSVSLDPAVYEAIDAIAIKEGVNFSEMLNRIVLDTLYNSKKGAKLREVTDRMYIVKLKELAGKLIVYEKTLEELKKLEEEVVKELDELRSELEVQEITPLFDKLMEFFDTYGLEPDLALREIPEVIDQISNYFMKNFGKQFDIHDFGRKVWLYEMSYEQYLYEQKESAFEE